MLTADQINALRDRAGEIADPILRYLLEDIARRVAEAGQLTSTASYQVWRAQQLGLSQKEIKKRLQELLNTSGAEIEKLMTQSAEVGYSFDLKHLPTAAAIPFEENAAMQKLVSAAVKLAQEDFTNLTQTLGMVDPYGHVQPLRDAYRQCMDYAFQQVFTGATDYNTAIRQATRNLADMGVRVIDYESGVHTSLEAAVRRNIMGGLGLMQEQISQQNHDEMGANGWEINAHAACAPDHEPIQGRQYSDEAFKRLNGSLKRRIGTLNCGHKEFPIILGVSEPQYTPAELEAMRQQNAKGVTIEGRHYSLYEATQMQRKMERSIRKQKKRILVDKATGDEEKLLIDQTKLRMQNANYKKFSDAAGLRTQRERAQVAGFGRKEAEEASRVPSGSGKPTADVLTVPNVSKNTVENKPQLIQGFMAGVNGDAGKAPASQLFSQNTVPTADPQKISSAILDNSNKTRYNTPPENELLERYTQDVKDGWISPLSGFDNYKQLYQQIESGIVGKTTSNGILITGQSRHFMQRVIGTMADPKKLADDLQIVHRSGTEISDIMDALFSPEKIDPPVIRENGRRSIRFIGSRGIVTVNPDTGQLIQTNQRKR